MLRGYEEYILLVVAVVAFMGQFKQVKDCYKSKSNCVMLSWLHPTETEIVRYIITP